MLQRVDDIDVRHSACIKYGAIIFLNFHKLLPTDLLGYRTTHAHAGDCRTHIVADRPNTLAHYILQFLFATK